MCDNTDPFYTDDKVLDCLNNETKNLQQKLEQRGTGERENRDIHT